MKAKAIITAVLLMACTIASAQTEKKYYMNVQTAPEEVQSYEVNSDLKVSWEQTQKGATPSGYYSKDEVDKMLQNYQRYLEDICCLLTGHRSDLYNLNKYYDSFPYGVLTYLTDICLLLTGDYDLHLFDYYRSFFPYGVLNNLIPHAKPETTPSMELMEENKVLKNKLAELERRLEALEAKK